MRYALAQLAALFESNPERLRLHNHRATSVDELISLRASQRTFEGAYVRTALGQFSFALVVLRIFTAEFYSIGALFACYGLAIVAVSVYRRHETNRQCFGEPVSGAGVGVATQRFRTSGNMVLALTTLSVGAYVSLLILIMRMDR